MNCVWLRARCVARAPHRMRPIPEQPEYAAAVRSFLARSPWWRRFGARMGLQSKLIICFMFLLLIGLSASYWLFLRETRTTMWHATCERAVALAQTLAMAASTPLFEDDTAEITRI